MSQLRTFLLLVYFAAFVSAQDEATDEATDEPKTWDDLSLLEKVVGCVALFLLWGGTVLCFYCCCCRTNERGSTCWNDCHGTEKVSACAGICWQCLESCEESPEEKKEREEKEEKEEKDKQEAACRGAWEQQQKGITR